MNIREQKEQREHSLLSLYAIKSTESKGRQQPEEPCPVRTCFERDRDRIVHSKAFRRLIHKTQVFISPEDDHYRTRLTHSIEVSQVARTIAVALGLNEALTEAIALGHDLGHTPFGHVGEAALNEVCPFPFEHNIQSLRIVERLEGGSGLNLTWEARDGIKNHCTGYTPSTLEGKAVFAADKIAYINHDIDDAIRAGIITEADIPAQLAEVLGDSASSRINNMVIDIVCASAGTDSIKKSDEVGEATMLLRDFLFENVYYRKEAEPQEREAKETLKSLYHYFIKNPEKMPQEYMIIVEEESLERAVCDYVAGMTDNYALSLFSQAINS
ncbi:MAG: deoxyguanosinetriphosphate triphosphohydrolase [Eubacteriaceae bacterium]|nr:deoxyguanosinetriphosphate triphosphohydrolase [Eubacteriaceae bacterium]